MDERDLEAEEAQTGRFVDQARAGLPQPLELGGEVGDLERDMMEAGTTTREEAPDRSVGVERRQELDPARTCAQRRRVDSLVLELSAMLELGAEEAGVGLDRGLDVVDCDPDVVRS
jgi:hypothetical protein